jgi:hypothetical protein
MLLKNDGGLGIIVSDSLITGKEFRIFRETILKEFDVRRIIQLPDKIFNKTEARTHIIILTKSKSTQTTCELFQSSIKGKLSKGISINKTDLVERMDYHFHKKKLIPKTGIITLKDIGVEIKRGRYSYKELREKNISYFHSVHFKYRSQTMNFRSKVSRNNIKYSAQPGDILMCRVGKRIVGKVALVNSGNVVISDCIYKIRVPKIYARIVFNSFLSPKGQKWLKGYAHGVCSQVISKSDLENFPLGSKCENKNF